MDRGRPHDSSLQALDVIRVPVSPQMGYRQLRRFARRWSKPGWAIEGAAGLGAPLTQWLTADGIEVTDVPAKLAARVRVLSTEAPSSRPTAGGLRDAGICGYWPVRVFKIGICADLTLGGLAPQELGGFPSWKC